MVKYTFNLKVGKEKYEIAIDLQKNLEDRPERYFTPAECEKIREDLQRQSSCKINDSHLRRIVTSWIEDILEGYRHSELTLDLPLMSEANIENLRESGNQEIPSVIYPKISEVEPLAGALPPLNFG